MATTTLRLPDDQLKALRMICIKIGKPMNRVLQELVAEFLADYFDSLEAEKALAEQGNQEWIDLDELVESVGSEAVVAGAEGKSVAKE